MPYDYLEEMVSAFSYGAEKGIDKGLLRFGNDEPRPFEVHHPYSSYIVENAAKIITAAATVLFIDIPTLGAGPFIFRERNRR